MIITVEVATMMMVMMMMMMMTTTVMTLIASRPDYAFSESDRAS